MRAVNSSSTGKGEFSVDCNQNMWMNIRPKDGKNYRPTRIEDVANVLTHGIFILPCVWMGCLLYSLSSSQGQFLSAVLYGGALVQLLTCSTLHHLMSLCGRSSSKIGKLAHVGDRVAIFIFIAASYTPWLMLRNYGAVDPKSVLWIIWIAVVVGLIIQVFYHDEYQNAEVLLYIAVGVGPSAVVIESICFNGWRELAFGGAMYIFGVVFYKLDGIMPFAHAVWHLFVVVGALAHYYAIYTNLYKNITLCDTIKPWPLEAMGF